MNPFLAGTGVFLFAAGIEFLQSGFIPAHFDSSSRLVAATVGSTFDWIDLFAYLAGSASIVTADRLAIMKRTRRIGASDDAA